MKRKDRRSAEPGSVRATEPDSSRHRQLAEASPDAILIHDGKRILYANRSAAELCDAGTPGRLIGRSPLDLVPPDSKKLVRQRMERILKAGQSVRADEQRLVTLKGRVIYVQVSGLPLLENGKRYVQTVFHDMTRAKEAEAAARETERRFSDVLENVRMAAVLLDRAGRITFINDWFLNLTGWRREEVMSRNFFDTFVPPEYGYGKMFLEKIRTGDIPVHHDDEIVTRQGARRRMAWTHVVLRGAGGAVSGTASLGMDISERAEYERLLEEKNIALKEILSQFQIERKEQAERLAASVRELVFPLLAALRPRCSEPDRQRIRVVEKELEQLTAAPRGLPDSRLRLSPREAEICRMIRGGLSTKEIADALRITPDTVDTHRTRIRKKLGIAAQKINLATYLQSA